MKRFFAMAWSWFVDHGNDHPGGLVRSGKWRCVYPNGTQTRRLSRPDAVICRDLWGGKVIFDPE